jgi:hypothetical protein
MCGDGGWPKERQRSFHLAYLGALDASGERPAHRGAYLRKIARNARCATGGRVL